MAQQPYGFVGVVRRRRVVEGADDVAGNALEVMHDGCNYRWCGQGDDGCGGDAEVRDEVA